MTIRHPDEIREAVRQTYARAAVGEACGCAPSQPDCCGGTPSAEQQSVRLGYAAADLSCVPPEADLGLGCGNPLAIAELQPGETVLDLGSGGGLDCLLAAEQVGDGGCVIGVDMTPEMIAKARENVRAAGRANVEFRLGEIEHLPVADASVDVVISNCVVNLSPDKPAVYREAHRVLKPGGRLAIMDIVATAPLAEEVRNDLNLIAGCVAGAETVAAIEAALHQAGFERIRVEVNEASREFIRDWAQAHGVEPAIASATIQASKPATAGA